MVLSTLAAVSLGATGAVLPPEAYPLLGQLVQLVGAIGAAALVAGGWRTAEAADRRFRRALLDVLVVWVVLHVLRTVTVLNGSSLPVVIDSAMLGIVALLIIRCWPRYLDR